MIIFLDTSALAKLFQAEEGTHKVIEWVNSAQKTTVLDLARLEFTSAIQRRYRNQELSSEDVSLIKEGFKERWDFFSVQPINRKVVDEAENLLNIYGSNFGLRSLDALHIAGFQLVAQEHWYFVAADKTLCKVIEDIGLNVLNPSDK